jgi:hypothetical protein
MMMQDTNNNLEQRLADIRQRVIQAAQRAGRNEDDIQLLAASKTRTVAEINHALEAGITLIGENRLQEAQDKFPDVAPVRRHFIGHLQTNKVKPVMDLFDCIESVDRLKLANAINREAGQRDIQMPIFIEINIGEEASKHGVFPNEAAQFLKDVAQLEHLRIEGLMAMPPFTKDPEAARPYFKTMKSLYNELRSTIGFQHLSMEPHLSMGTSQDFEVAVEEGSTIIRLGTALFGPRSIT